MIIGFKKQFKDPILNGTKIHTIRKDECNRWSIGKLMHQATGVRTKKYHCFAKKQCTGTQRIKIDTSAYYMNDYFVEIDGRKLKFEETQKLAWNDGFINLIDFYQWFSNGYSGKIIHWTNLRY